MRAHEEFLALILNSDEKRVDRPHHLTLIPAHDLSKDRVMQEIENEALFRLLSPRSASLKSAHVEHVQRTSSVMEGTDEENEMISKLVVVLQGLEEVQAQYLHDLEPSIKTMLQHTTSKQAILDNDTWNANVSCSRQWTQDVYKAMANALQMLDSNLIKQCNSVRQTSISTDTSDITNDDVILPSDTAVTSPELSQKAFCHHCGIVDTPEWRKGPHVDSPLCNACGLFFSKLVKGYNKDIAAFILETRKREGISTDRRVPQVCEFKGLSYTKRKNGHVGLR